MQVWLWHFKILYIKIIFRQIGSKLKTLSDIVQNLHARHFVGVEYRFDSLIWTRLSCDFLLKTFRRIYLKNFTRTNLKVLNTNLRLKFWYYLSNTSILAFGPKIKVSLNLRENLHTRQLEDSGCIWYDEKIYKFKSNFEKRLIQHSVFVKGTWKFDF